MNDRKSVVTPSAALGELVASRIVDVGDVAQATGATRRSVNRWVASKATPRRGTEVRLRELKAVVDVLRTVLRDEPARLWLRAPNPDLDWHKPLELIAEGEHSRVINSLVAIADGVTA